MNFRFVYISLFIFSFICSYSQSTKNVTVEYQAFNNTELPNTYMNTLEIQGQASIFFEKRSSQKPWKQNQPDDGTTTTKSSGEFDPYLKIDREKKEMLSFELVGDNVFLVKDNYTELKWKIGSEKKEIAGHSCIKASTEFRGRTWEVWFTPDIPVSFGPWKLHGLPGLILEAYDSTKRFSFVAVNISFNKGKFFEKSFNTLMKSYNSTPVSYEKAVKDDQEYWDNKYKSLRQSSNNNVVINKAPRNGMELKYEWETKGK